MCEIYLNLFLDDTPTHPSVTMSLPVESSPVVAPSRTVLSSQPSTFRAVSSMALLEPQSTVTTTPVGGVDTAHSRELILGLVVSAGILFFGCAVVLLIIIVIAVSL